MRIFDENGIEIENPDFALGHLKPDQMFVRHHEAVEGVEEVFHYEYTTYPNGGRDRHKVIDVEAVEAKEAWDEYEDIMRYVLYTAEELAEMEERKKQSAEYRVKELESLLAILTGVEA